MWKKWQGYTPLGLSDEVGFRIESRKKIALSIVTALLILGIFAAVATHRPSNSLLSDTKDVSPNADRTLFLDASDSLRRIAIVMHNSNDTEMFTSTDFGSNHNHASYARIHSYPFLLESHPYVNFTERPVGSGTVKSSREHGYNKLLHLQEAIMYGMRTGLYDWVFWADADTWIANPSILLESYLPPEAQWDAEPAPYLIAAPDLNGFNDGTMFFRANYWSLSVLSQAFAELYHPTTRFKSYSDQRSISRTLTSDAAVAEHFWRVPQTWFNQYPGTVSKKQSPDGDFAIHDHTIQIHLVDKLKKDPVMFKENMDRIRDMWSEMVGATRRDIQAQKESKDISQDEVLRLSVDVLKYNSLTRNLTLDYWKNEAVSGIDDVKWLDIQRR